MKLFSAIGLLGLSLWSIAVPAQTIPPNFREVLRNPCVIAQLKVDGRLQSPYANMRGGTYAVTVPTYERITGTSPFGVPQFEQSTLGKANSHTFGSMNVGAGLYQGASALNAQVIQQGLGGHHTIFDFGSTLDAGLQALAAMHKSYTTTLPAGTYTLNQVSYNMQASQILVGAGIDQTKIIMPANCTLVSNAVLQFPFHDFAVVENLTIEGNGCAPPSSPSGSFGTAISILGASSAIVQNVRIIGFTGPIDAIALDSVKHFLVRNVHVTQRKSTTHSHCILVAKSAGLSTDGVISGNTCVGGGLLISSGSVRIYGNDISGWNYGAGVTLNAEASPEAMVFGNTIHDSGKAADADGTYPNGIEDWGDGTVVADNNIYNVASSCIFSGNSQNQIVGNRCYSASQAGAPGGNVAYANTGSSNNFFGNAVIPDMSGDVLFGYADGSGSTANALSGNSFWGVTAPYKLSSTTSTAFGSIFFDDAGRWLNTDYQFYGAAWALTVRKGTGTEIIALYGSGGQPGTIRMPASPPPGQEIRFVFPEATTLTWTPASGQSITSAPASVVAGEVITATYNAGSWYF